MLETENFSSIGDRSQMQEFMAELWTNRIYFNGRTQRNLSGKFC